MKPWLVVRALVAVGGLVMAAPAAAVDAASVTAAIDAATSAEGPARIEALGPAMQNDAVEILRAEVNGEDVDRAALALVALAELVAPSACEAVLQAPAHLEPEWQVASANAAARCGDMGPLRALLAGPDVVLRLKAAVTLGILGDEASEAGVLALLEDPEVEGHTAFVALAAGLLGRAEARGARDVRWRDGQTRVHAALALSRLGAEDVTLDLIFALDDVGDPILRHAILDEVVARLPPTGRAAVESMASSDPSPRIVESATRAAQRWRHLRPRDGSITQSPPAQVRPRPD